MERDGSAKRLNADSLYVRGPENKHIVQERIVQYTNNVHKYRYPIVIPKVEHTG